jgi:hypothetical protein
MTSKNSYDTVRRTQGLLRFSSLPNGDRMWQEPEGRVDAARRSGRNRPGHDPRTIGALMGIARGGVPSL